MRHERTLDSDYAKARNQYCAVTPLISSHDIDAEIVFLIRSLHRSNIAEERGYLRYAFALNQCLEHI